MKKLILFGVVFVPLMMAVGIGSLLIAANRVGEESQRPLFEAVATGDPACVLNLLDPRLQDQIDLPVLSEWMKAVNENLGAYEGIRPAGFNTHVSSGNGATVTTSEAKVVFQHGEAQSKIVYQGDQITSFDITSELLDGDWFKGPADTTLYRERAEAFYNEFGAGEILAAHQMMYPTLQKAVTKESLSAMHASVTDAIGDFESADFIDDEFVNGEKQTLTARFRLIGSDAYLDAKATFQFVGLQAVLVAFEMN